MKHIVIRADWEFSRKNRKKVNSLILNYFICLISSTQGRGSNFQLPFQTRINEI